jgi:hypothetical protein
MALYVPGTEETDPKKIIMSQQLVAGQTTTNTTDIATNTAAIAALNAATYVNSINRRTGAITLNSTSGITNSSNDIILSQASSSQFGAVKVDGTTITASSGVISAVAETPTLSKITASLGADVSMNNTANYFAGPTVAQGTSGTWFASGTVSILTGAGVDTNIYAKLWDGTTIIASVETIARQNQAISLSVSGFIASPAGNIRIDCRAVNNTTAVMAFNTTGNSKDCTITAVRIG